MNHLHETTDELARQTIDWASVFAQQQAPDGSVDVSSGRMEEAELALANTIEAYEKLCDRLGGFAVECFELFSEDISRWQSNGLMNQPNFVATHSRWRPSEDASEYVPFLGPIRIPNGIRGNSFVLNFALTKRQTTRNAESVRAATASLPNFKEITIIDAPYRSPGYSGGEGSVLFSELLCSEKRRGPQTFGAFIISDFAANYKRSTQNAPIIKGPMLADLVTYDLGDDPVDERTMWLQVHDNFHDIGALPHSEHLAVKMNFAAAVLDELKADGSAYLSLKELDTDRYRMGARHLIDKMFRFPFSPYAYKSVDGAVGELFLRAAARSGGLYTQNAGQALELEPSKLDECIEGLVDDVLKIESEGSDPEIYVELCKSYLQKWGVSSPPQRKPLRWSEGFDAIGFAADSSATHSSTN